MFRSIKHLMNMICGIEAITTPRETYILMVCDFLSKMFTQLQKVNLE